MPEKQSLEDQLEAAYWRFDALHKAHYRDVDPKLAGPLSERDAFKCTLRAHIARELAALAVVQTTLEELADRTQRIASLSKALRTAGDDVVDLLRRRADNLEERPGSLRGFEEIAGLRAAADIIVAWHIVKAWIPVSERARIASVQKEPAP